VLHQVLGFGHDLSQRDQANDAKYTHDAKDQLQVITEYIFIVALIMALCYQSALLVVVYLMWIN